MFYTGNTFDNNIGEEKKIPDSSIQLDTFISSLSSFDIDTFTCRKINDAIINCKYEKLGIPFPSLELTPFSVEQVNYTQNNEPGPISEPMVDQNGFEDDQWLSKLNNDKIDEEFSMLGTIGTQETTQTFDNVRNYIDQITLTAEEYRILGLDINSKENQDKIIGSITLGDGNPAGLAKIFKEANDWEQFQQFKLPRGIAGENIDQGITKRKKKDDEILIFDPTCELTMADLFKNTHKRSTSARKNATHGVSSTDYSELTLEKNYHFPLNRLTKLALRPMLLKLKLDTKQMNLNGKIQNEGGGIVIDTQMDEENNFVPDGPEAIEEEVNAYREIEQEKENEIELKLDQFSKVVNPRLLKARLWSEIEHNVVDEITKNEMGIMYKTEFSSLFETVQDTQECSPQACFVCLLHLANEKGNYNENYRADYRSRKYK